MRYTIQRAIGDPGGFGTVHLCTSETGGQYAIKILHKMDALSTERFQKEIRLTMRLSHPNIIKILDYNADAPQKFYIMPLYASSLVSVIPQLYNEYARQYSVISAVLNGVIYLHAEGVLHRDLKPQNILYNSDNDIVINDFGLGRQINSHSDRLTHFGDAFGTQRYTAPEQFMDASSVTEKADIFSLGKIIEDIVTNMLSSPVPTEGLGYIIDKCTQPNPDSRFRSVLDLKTAIDSVYQNLLGIAENDRVDHLLSELQLGAAADEAVYELARMLLSDKNSDQVEKFFQYIADDQYLYLENKDSRLAESLVNRLQKYYTQQQWGFGFTDVIGDNCRRLYQISNDVTVKANLLYIIIQVGISHNRWHVMGIASALLKEVKYNIPECLELASLLEKGRISLHNLNMERADLAACLQTYYQRKRNTEEL